MRYLMMQLRSFWKLNLLCREYARYLKVYVNYQSKHFTFFCYFLVVLHCLFFSVCESGLLVQLISLSWTEPELVVFLGRYLDVLCPFLRLTAAVAIVVIKLLELISSINVDYHVSLVLSCSVKMKIKY